MLNLSRVILSARLGAMNLVIEEVVGTLVNEGDFATTTTTRNTRGQVHPPTDADMRRLPEGTRAEEVIKVLTVERLVVANSVSTESCVVQYDGRRWKLYAGKDWKHYGYYRSYAELIHEVAQ